ncbi:MAG: hypothetical protein UF412_05670 [Anaerostipes hadrus]|nr:hypothetical protein [Anaerostipes hadrus]
MGEKRAYKSRKPGGGRKKLKPEYDAGKNLKEQMERAVALYEEDCSLRSIADVLTLNPIKVRKLLITAGVYESEVAEKVQDTFEEYREIQNYKDTILSTANTLQLSKASVTSYLIDTPNNENGIKWCEHAILWEFEDCGIAKQWNNPGTSESGKIYF